jgi:hypothetical protein
VLADDRAPRHDWRWGDGASATPVQEFCVAVLIKLETPVSRSRDPFATRGVTKRRRRTPGAGRPRGAKTASPLWTRGLGCLLELDGS